MPYRCQNCYTLSASEEAHNCPDETLCDLVRVDIIHLMTPNGFGKVLSKMHGRDPNDETKTVDILLKLGCESKIKSPTSTPVHYAVTCLNCLKNFPPLKEQNEDDLDPAITIE